MTAAKDERAQRRAILGNDRRIRDASAYVDHVHDESGGRFANQTSRMTIGEKPTINYPAAATWTRDRLPDELPLGVDINAQEPTGEPPEVAASLGEVHNGTDPPSEVVEHASPDEGPRSMDRTASCETAPSSPPQSKRKSRKKG